MVELRGGIKADSASVIPTYEDTAAASRGNRANYYPHSLIGVKNDLWMRDAEGLAGDWLRVGASALVCNGLQFGGVVTWDSLLVFDVTAAGYCINNQSYFSLDSTVTLGASDPSLPRIDVIAVDTAGDVIVIPGTPAADPAKPQVNPNSQLELTSILINAGATTPSGINKLIIYNENLGTPSEWNTGSTMSSGTVNFDNTNFPYIGSKAALVSNQADGTLSFSISDTNNIINYSLFQLFLRRGGVSDPTSGIIQIGFKFEGVQVSNLIQLNSVYGYNPAISGSYQNIAIPLSYFLITSPYVDEVFIKVVGNDQMYVDYVQLQSGISFPSIQVEQLWARNGTNITA